MTLIHGLGMGKSSKTSSATDPGTEMEQHPHPYPTTHLLYNELTSSNDVITLQGEVRRLN